MGWLIAILAGGFLTFNAVVTPDKAADKAEAALRERFPDAEVKVVIEGKRGKDVLNGRFRKVDIELGDLALDELNLQTGAPAPKTPIVAGVPGGAIAATAPRPASAPQFAPVEIPAPRAAKAEKIRLGRATELNIVLRDLKWQSLPVERAEIRLSDVEYDFGALKERAEFKLVRLGRATMHLELAPEALTPLVARRLENVTNARVVLSDGQMGVTGARNFYGVAAPFEVRGAPGFRGAQVILQSPRLLVSGIGVPSIVAAPILKNVNPLYSLENLQDAPFAVTLTRVESRDGKLQIDGDLALK